MILTCQQVYYEEIYEDISKMKELIQKYYRGYYPEVE